MDALQVTPISQANANQRSGRAGRTGPGKCFRIYRSSAYREEMLENNIPEIQRTNLSNVVLLLKSLNISNIMDFDFMDTPSEDTLLNAMYQLWILGALNNEGQLTKMGRKMAEFPLDPSLSKVLLVSEKLGCSEEALIIVSMLSVPKLFNIPKGQEAEANSAREKLMVVESDHLSLLKIFKTWEENKESMIWSKKNYLQQKSLKKVKEIMVQLKDIMKSQKIEISSAKSDYNQVRKAICAGFFPNAARLKTIGKYTHLKNGLSCVLHPSSALFLLGYPPDYVIYNELLMTSREYMLCVTTVDPIWLAEFGNIFFDIKNAESLTSIYSFRNDKDSVSGIDSKLSKFKVFKYEDENNIFVRKKKFNIEELDDFFEQNHNKNSVVVGKYSDKPKNKPSRRFQSKFKSNEILNKRKTFLPSIEEEEENLEIIINKKNDMQDEKKNKLTHKSLFKSRKSKSKMRPK